MKTIGQVQASFQKRDQRLCAHGHSYSRFEGGLSDTGSCLDPMRFGPFGEQFDSPMLAVHVGDQLEFEYKAVDQENGEFASRTRDHNAARSLHIICGRIIYDEPNCLVAHHRGPDAIRGVRLASFELNRK